MLKKLSIVAAAMMLPAFACHAAGSADQVARSTEAMRTFVAKAPGPARALLEKSLCIAVIPQTASGSFEPGQGIISCRPGVSAPWSAPAGIDISGGGVIWDLASTQMSVFLLVNTPDAVKRMSGAAVILGVDVSAYPGPLRTDSNEGFPRQPGAFGYSISGDDIEPVALGGGTVNEDTGLNQQIYGSKLHNAEILTGSRQRATSAAVRDFIAVLPKAGAGVTEQ